MHTSTSVTEQGRADDTRYLCVLLRFTREYSIPPCYTRAYFSTEFAHG